MVIKLQKMVIKDMEKIKLLVINGPNLNMLGIREPGIYGSATYSDLVAFIENAADRYGVSVSCFQSNHEGEIVDKIQSAFIGDERFDGIIINPAAYTHTSVAILDALKSVSLPAVEVHISDVSKREDFRQISYVKKACVATFAGYGFDGYAMAIEKLTEFIKKD